MMFFTSPGAAAAPVIRSAAIAAAAKLAEQRAVEPRQRYLELVATLAGGGMAEADHVLQIVTAANETLPQLDADTELFREYRVHLGNLDEARITTAQAACDVASEAFLKAREAYKLAEQAAETARCASRDARHKCSQAERRLSDVRSLAHVSDRALHSGRFVKFDSALVAAPEEPEKIVIGSDLPKHVVTFV